MSKLNELIQKLCPNGVDFVPLWSVTIWDKKFNSVKREKQEKVISYPYLLAKDMFALEQEKGNVFLLSTGEQTGWTTEEIAGDYLCEGEIVSIPWGKSRKVSEVMKYYKGKFVTADNRIATSKDTNKLLNKYLFYWMMSQGELIDSFYRGSGLKHPNMKYVLDMQIPLPPLEVQNEIVRILDNFTQLTAELTAELTARKKQYEYYRDKLLTFDKTISIAKLGDIIVSLNTGLNPRQFFKLNTDDAQNYYVTIREIQNGTIIVSEKTDRINDDALRLCNNRSNLEVGDVLFSGTGTIGETAVISEPPCNWNIKEGVYTIKPKKDILNARYLMYILRTEFMKAKIAKKVAGGTVKSISMAEMKKLEIPIPTLDIQKRLVNVLDNFDTICSDLKIGLPAEIEARKKQYEFYRDALLNYVATGKIVHNRTEQNRTEQFRGLIALCQYIFGSIFIELGYIGKVSMCKRILKSETNVNGEIPFFKIGTFGKEPDSYISKEKFEEYKSTYSYPNKGDILISASGTIGRTVIFNGEPAYYQDSNIVWIANDESIVLNKYLYYCYQLQPWNISTGGTIARLYNDNISKTKIAIPPIKEQKRIVAILDRFDSLCNDISYGLPAEIEARQKQYEFYRDKLLSFKSAN